MILFPENLFYNTSAAGIIVFLNRNKSQNKKEKIILLNASKEFYKGRPKNHISDESIEKITQAFIESKDQEKFVKVITSKEAAKNDYNLSPSRYISLNDAETYRAIPDILNELETLKTKSNKLDKEMDKVISMIELD